MAMPRPERGLGGSSFSENSVINIFNSSTVFVCLRGVRKTTVALRVSLIRSWRVSAHFDVGLVDDLGSWRNPLGVTPYKDL